MRLSTFVGSLVDQALDAHAIVNASNPHVGLGSGVSGAIRAACGGAAFQTEVRRAWEDAFDEPLEAGDCLVTGAGTARAFRWVLHVPAVDYTARDPETGGSSGPARTQACAAAALEEAGALAEAQGLVGRFVLGFPLLGAGHGGLGEVASAAAMMRAFVDAPVGVGEVRVAVLEERLARLVEHAAERFGLR
ncbi:MAG: hypothetical protein SangKO_051440 [Sandaracinaceae bacterium]